MTFLWHSIWRDKICLINIHFTLLMRLFVTQDLLLAREIYWSKNYIQHAIYCSTFFNRKLRHETAYKFLLLFNTSALSQKKETTWLVYAPLLRQRMQEWKNIFMLIYIFTSWSNGFRRHRDISTEIQFHGKCAE